jgi:WXG100 family type VII secretion target
MADRIEVNYEELGNLAKRFTSEGEVIGQLYSSTRQKVEGLHNAGWIGRGADTFFAEMQTRVLPGLDRLSKALLFAAESTQKISNIYRNGEEESSSLFKQSDGDYGNFSGIGTGGSAGAATGGATGYGDFSGINAGSGPTGSGSEFGSFGGIGAGGGSADAGAAGGVPGAAADPAGAAGAGMAAAGDMDAGGGGGASGGGGGGGESGGGGGGSSGMMGGLSSSLGEAMGGVSGGGGSSSYGIGGASSYIAPSSGMMGMFGGSTSPAGFQPIFGGSVDPVNPGGAGLMSGVALAGISALILGGGGGLWSLSSSNALHGLQSAATKGSPFKGLK